MRDDALARCPGNGRGSASGRGPLSEKKGDDKSRLPFFGPGPVGPGAHSASPRTRLGPERKRFSPCQGWRNGWGVGREQGGTGGSGREAEIAPCPPAKPPGTMGSREGSPPPDTHPRGRFGVAGKAGRGKGAGVSRRGLAPSLTILPSQSGEIRLAANLLDTRRRFAPPTKGAGSGRNGGYRGKGWREAERVRLSGEIRLTANLLDTRRRFAPLAKVAGRGRNCGHREKAAGGGTGTAKRGDSPCGESSGYAASRSTASEKWRGAGGVAGMGKGWREAERVRLSGEIRLVANLWIRGAGGAVANEKRRRAAESKNASPQGEAFGGGQERTRRRRSSAEE